MNLNQDGYDSSDKKSSEDEGKTWYQLCCDFVGWRMQRYSCIYVSGQNISTQSNLFLLLEFLIISYKYLRDLHWNECTDCYLPSSPWWHHWVHIRNIHALCWRVSQDHRHSKVISELSHSTKPFHGKRCSAPNLGQDKIMVEF